MVEIEDEGTSVANKNRACVSDESIAIIRSWLQAQPHLPDQDVDDSLVARFIHCSDNDLDKCKATMDHFFKLRAAAPEFFTNRDPFQANIRTVFEIIDIIPLPNLTEEGYKVFLFRLADPNPDRFNYLDYLRTFFLIADTRMKTEKEFPTGEVPILDMSGFTLRHLTKINFSALRKQMQYVQEAHPVKLKQVHVINTLPILERIMTLFKPLIKKEVASMLHFHVPNSNTLEKFIPKCYLPNEYGGKAGPLKQLKQHWINKAESERDWLVSNPWCARNSSSSSSQTKHDENTNIHNIIDEEKAGQGSFRSLSID